MIVIDAVQPDPSSDYPLNAGDDRKPSNFDKHPEFVGRSRRRFSRSECLNYAECRSVCKRARRKEAGHHCGIDRRWHRAVEHGDLLDRLCTS